MPDDLENRENRSRGRINVQARFELKRWMNAFECSEDQLRAAVAEVGANVDALRKHLWKRAGGQC